jgi:hypothetical protein
MSTTSVQYGQVPFQFINGFGIANQTLISGEEVLFVYYGKTLDSNDTYQISMKPTVMAIFPSVIGINGLDKGPLLPNKVYAVYVAWDTVGTNATAAFFSSSYYHPTIPYGYNAVKLVGYAATDATSKFRQAKWTPYGSSPYRNMIYAPSVTVLENGTANTETNVNLISYIPNLSGGNQIVNLQLSFTSSTPGNSLTIYSEMGEFKLYAQVAGVPNTSSTNLIITTQVLLDGVISPVIGYSVTNSGTDSASIYCNGYDFFL